jgi:hypothetical protein
MGNQSIKIGSPKRAVADLYLLQVIKLTLKGANKWLM